MSTGKKWGTHCMHCCGLWPLLTEGRAANWAAACYCSLCRHMLQAHG